MVFETKTLKRVASLLFVFYITLLVTALAQDPSGRPAEPKQDPSGRPNDSRPTKPSKKPTKPPTRRSDPGPATVTLTVLTDPPQVNVLIDGEARGASNAEG